MKNVYRYPFYANVSYPLNEATMLWVNSKSDIPFEMTPLGN